MDDHCDRGCVHHNGKKLTINRKANTMIPHILSIATLILVILMAWHIWHSDEQDQLKRQRRTHNPKHK
jgi:hypothetical protein